MRPGIDRLHPVGEVLPTPCRKPDSGRCGDLEHEPTRTERRARTTLDPGGKQVPNGTYGATGIAGDALNDGAEVVGAVEPDWQYCHGSPDRRRVSLPTCGVRARIPVRCPLPKRYVVEHIEVVGLGRGGRLPPLLP